METSKLLARLKPYMPTPTEKGEWRGLLSTLKEWHALIIGLGVGMVSAAAGEPVLMTTVAGVAVGNIDAGGERLKDVAAEPAYAFAGLFIGYALIGGTVNPEAFTELFQLADLFSDAGPGG